MWSVWLVFCDCGFHSAHPQMDKDKRLMEASWWERLTVEKTGSCSDADKDPSSQSYGFSSSHVWMWELNHKESWVSKNWCFWTVILEKTLESPLDSKEIKLVNPKGNQSWIFIGRTNAEVEAPIHWPPEAKNWLIRKDPDAGKDWRQEQKGTTEDEVVAWHHRLNGHEFEQALGDGDGQGSLVCFSPWGCKESDMTEQLKTNRWWGGQGYTGRLALTSLHYCI